jgi:hypothetical protein
VMTLCDLQTPITLSMAVLFQLDCPGFCYTLIANVIERTDGHYHHYLRQRPHRLVVLLGSLSRYCRSTETRVSQVTLVSVNTAGSGAEI